MANLKVLDCTLRDGGYVNDFNFGRREITEIIGKLSQAGLDIIECGFLDDGANDPDRSLFAGAEEIARVLSKKNPNCMYVAMLQLGRYSVEKLCPFDGRTIDGVRLTFHEHEIDEAFRVGRAVMQKGYKLFMQPVGTNTFPDNVLYDLVERINALHPYAFYLVDTLGSMYKSDLLRLLLSVDHNLSEDILMGFHSHNNLQLSFANSQLLSEWVTRRTVILDASVFGMGRGAGNLCTELICQYINQTTGERYSMLPVLEIMDEYINPIFRKTPWGYSAAYYLSSVNGCHPNYATYFLDKQTISVRDIHNIIRSMEPKKRVLFDRAYAEERYISHLRRSVDDAPALAKIREVLGGRRRALVLAPGKSLSRAGEKIEKFMDAEKPAVFSVNFIPKVIPVDAAFVSNLRRFRNLEGLDAAKGNIIVTSNITCEDDRRIVVNYASYLNENPEISDNAGLMLINLLLSLGVRSFTLAGFDGYSINPSENYYTERLVSTAEDARLLRMNRAIAQRVAQLRMQASVQFLTPSMYDSEKI